MIKLKIAEPVPSLNVTNKEHWSKKMVRRKKYENQIILQLLQHYKYKDRLAAQKRVKRSVTIHSQRARLLDVDNLYGGGKSLLDAIRKCKLIVDDDDKWLESLEYTQAVGKPYYTEITIK
jgi:Holliday junction resolvase RusA-like endonuclease